MDSVLNWLWQGSTVALTAATMLRWLGPSSARLRYRALWGVLLTILVLPVVPLLWAAPLPGPEAPGAAAPRNPVVTLPPGWWTSTNVVLALWAAWSFVLAARVARAAVALRRAKTAISAVPTELEARLRCWGRLRTTGRRVRLALSPSVRSAAVLGGRSPMIVLSPALVDHLTDQELDRVVIHEWAHVQRYDDRAHLLQVLADVAAGWHPAVWWCNRQLNLEREIACDEMAVAITGSPKAYAACLTRVAGVQSVTTRPLRVALGLGTSGLRRRIVRILSVDQVAAPRAGRGAAIAAVVLVGLTAIAVGSFPVIGAAPLTAAALIPARVIALGLSAPVEPASVIDSGDQRQPVQAMRAPARQTAASQTPAPAPEAAVEAPRASVPPDVASHEAEPPRLDSKSGAAASAFAVPVDLARPTGPASSSAGASVSDGPERPSSPWVAAADVGVAVGRGTQDAGVAVSRGTQDAAVSTAGFFNRLGRKIADSF